MFQKDLRDIWGFVCAAEYEVVELPTARLMQCSRSSRRDASSLAAASLKAEGLIVANDNSCATVCDVTNALAGWVGTFVVSNREMVGNKTPRTCGPGNRFHCEPNSKCLHKLTKMLGGPGEKRSKSFPDFNDRCSICFRSGALMYGRGHFGCKLDKARYKKSRTLTKCRIAT